VVGRGLDERVFALAKREWRLIAPSAMLRLLILALTHRHEQARVHEIRVRNQFLSSAAARSGRIAVHTQETVISRRVDRRVDLSRFRLFKWDPPSTSDAYVVT